MDPNDIDEWVETKLGHCYNTNPRADETTCIVKLAWKNEKGCSSPNVEESRGNDREHGMAKSDSFHTWFDINL